MALARTIHAFRGKQPFAVCVLGRYRVLGFYQVEALCGCCARCAHDLNGEDSRRCLSKNGMFLVAILNIRRSTMTQKHRFPALICSVLTVQILCIVE